MNSNSWSGLFRPYSTFDNYFPVYYDLVKRIYLYGDKQLRLLVHLANMLMVAKAAHFLYLIVNSSDKCSSSTPVQTALNFDVFCQVLSNARVNGLLILCALMIFYCNWYLLLLNGDGGRDYFRLLQLLYRVMVLRDFGAFLAGDNVKQKNNGKAQCDKVRKIYMWTLNGFLSILISFEFLMVYCYLYFGYILIVEHSGILALFWPLVNMHLLVLLHTVYFLNYTHQMATIFPLMASLLGMFFVKMRQALSILNTNNYNSNNSKTVSVTVRMRTFTTFRVHYVQTLVYFFAVNRAFSRFFLAILFVFVPVNVVLSVDLLIPAYRQNAGPGKLAFPIFWMVYAYNFNFVVHLLLAKCSKCIHRPGKRLLRIAADLQCNRKRPTCGFRHRLALNSCFAAIHTKKKYGITYGPVGLVSMMAFIKFFLLYGEFMMATYKLSQLKWFI